MKIKSLGFIHAPLLRKSGAGFTLIELLIVIVVLGVLATVVMIAINPLGMINSANIAKTKTFSASVENLLSISQVGKWSFESVDANNKTPDTSGYGNNGTLIGGAALQTSDQCGLGFGGCFNFDQTNYVSVPHSSSLNLTSDMTISLWIKPTDLSNYHVLAKRSGCGGYGISYQIHAIGGGRFGFVSGASSPRGVDSVSKLSSSVWNYIVVSVKSNGDGTVNVKLYINGILDNEGTGGLDPTNSADLKIGDAGTGCLPQNMFKGLIDEVVIYSQALLSSQIKQLYVQGLSKHQLVYNK